MPAILDKYKDTAAGRITAIHTRRLSLQVLSYHSATNLEDLDGSRQANDAA